MVEIKLSLNDIIKNFENSGRFFQTILFFSTWLVEFTLSVKKSC